MIVFHKGYGLLSRIANMRSAESVWTLRGMSVQMILELAYPGYQESVYLQRHGGLILAVPVHFWFGKRPCSHQASSCNRACIPIPW